MESADINNVQLGVSGIAKQASGFKESDYVVAFRQLDRHWAQVMRFLRKIGVLLTGSKVSWPNQSSQATAVSFADRVNGEVDQQVPSVNSKQELHHAAR